MQTIQIPHSAIIHLLKSLGCCESQSTPPSSNSTTMDILVRQKLQLEEQLNQIRFQTNTLPCLVTIDTEIYQMKTIISGLRNQYQIRMHEAQMQIQNVSSSINNEGTYKQRSEYTGEYQREVQEHRRLQEEYHSLLSKIKRIHDQNQSIIDNYGKREYRRYA